jgi:hypothetical protein
MRAIKVVMIWGKWGTFGTSTSLFVLYRLAIGENVIAVPNLFSIIIYSPGMSAQNASFGLHNGTLSAYGTDSLCSDALWKMP